MTTTRYYVSWQFGDEAHNEAHESLDLARAALAAAVAEGATPIRVAVEGGGDCAILRRTVTTTDRGFEP